MAEIIQQIPHKTENILANWLTLLPAIVAIAVVLWRKEVILALLLSLCTAELLIFMQQGQGFGAGLLLDGSIQTLERIVAVTADDGNARILMFSLLVGGLLAYLRLSGGVTATVDFLVRKGIARTGRQAGLLTFGISFFTFIESNLSSLTKGISTRGLFDKFQMSRARLAYIIDSTSSPICIIILLNGWGAYVLGLLSTYELPVPAISVLLGSIPLNFYALFTLAVVLYTIISGKVYGPLKRVEQRASEQLPQTEIETPASHPAFMLLPLITLVGSMIGFMFLTGNGELVQGSGSRSVLYATVLACLVAYAMMIISRRFQHQQLVDMGFKGMSELLPVVTIVLLSMALGSSLKVLGTGTVIAGMVDQNIPHFLIPALLFLAGSLMSVTTGTSWGTFAILIPIGIPMVTLLNLPPQLVLAAILSGGIFGDHCSPISDSTAVSSVAAGCDLLEHVKTQLPYALFCGALALSAFAISGWLMI
ncbi:Na+/H+ antiporter NhaC family protein [Alishewanella sp. SMS8]|uniref:Na+/H+ antiporter NhaC family protein n=1 Tax=Alishewanella sp. SMS8 TaxID=2994676 RepID=UPI00274126B6|nr:Na+/H+ antiporter NhaC family protein [Alishewanella sp. SMS8]MDP4944950.1 sodium:proton antiporter [Alishewanella sp.]MDP5207339.1 sodium:proton antiporter [Alishewanella sp. SMS9]MDP5035995.1 sodium:proton antiporter [Alishewanella sp.]MDP5185893.1 sodium:proton antiporter [Alishewanella sp.]MDP5459766.1 Na+/H+ antiporter NhaC family protein [Alishewanella sp. SMS8]